MSEYQFNFYNGKLGHEEKICSCDEMDLMAVPDEGDLVELPFDIPESERDVYVIMQKHILPCEINYFCKLYEWDI